MIERLLSRTEQVLTDESGRPTLMAIRETGRELLEYIDPVVSVSSTITRGR
ncbi:MAG TPA: hypothetical protein VI248_07190 [Kineosporiaceae bacterium]